MKQLLKIITILIFSFTFISCEKGQKAQENQSLQQQEKIVQNPFEIPEEKSIQELSKEEISKELTSAINNKNWQEVDNILDSIPEDSQELPEILKLIDNGDVEQFKKKVKKLDEYIYVKTAYNDCVSEEVDLSITPLGYAVEKNKIEIVRFLLSQNTNIEKGIYNKVVEQDWAEIKSPLFIAVSKRNKRMTRLLLSRWADANFVFDEISGDCKNSSSSVLIEAVKWGDKDIINLLLDKRADVNKIIWQGDTKVSALDYAKNEEIKQILIAQGAKNSKYLK